MFQTASTCSHESCYGCITNSESSEEFQKLGSEVKPELKSTTEAHIPESASKIQWRNRMRKTSKNSSESRSDTLKVSHFSKSLVDNFEMQSQSLEAGKKFDNMKSRQSQNSSNLDYTFPRNKIQSEPSQKSNISRVVDVVPKPKFPIDYQTIGIPIQNVSPIRSCQTILLNSDSSNFFNYSKALSVQESLSVSNKMSNDMRSEPQIIHHPLISYNIKPINNVVSRTESSFTPKSISHDSVNVPIINRSAASQQTSSTKRENGERNKVKFCNTVTVAVVPVSFLK